ncbi:DUF5666 domain-containing protein [Kutzneria sp. NPDC052558]|uniref:DUF5666 domain-containing protein n=1 Tax=Kutzneria sp. NPDC052558 TaxID=3364121 RepID=UPI0037C7EF65
MTRRTRIVLITGAAVAALVASGGVAYAVSAPTTTTTPTAAQPSTAKHHRALLGRVSHGEVTLRGKNHRVVDVQRGQVQSVSPTSLTVKSDDGFTATYTVDADTKIRKAGKASAITDVHNGDTVAVVATKSNGADTATRVAER